MNKYWKVVRYPLLVELAALVASLLVIGVLTWLKSNAVMASLILLVVGPVLAFVLLLRKCYENDFGFSRTLLVMFGFWYLHTFGFWLLYGSLAVAVGELNAGGNIIDLLPVALWFALLGLVPALITAFVYGLVRIWTRAAPENRDLARGKTERMMGGQS